MDLNKKFSLSLKHYRELAEMSQEKLADASELDRTYISQLERGLKSPALTTLQKLATCLGVEAQWLLRKPFVSKGPRVPKNYIVRKSENFIVSRHGKKSRLPLESLTSAINIAHELIDSMYAIDLDIASILGMRNLSAFIGELFAAAIVKNGDGLFEANPHQDGYPDLLLMDETGRKE